MDHNQDIPDVKGFFRSGLKGTFEYIDRPEGREEKSGIASSGCTDDKGETHDQDHE